MTIGTPAPKPGATLVLAWLLLAGMACSGGRQASPTTTPVTSPPKFTYTTLRSSGNIAYKIGVFSSGPCHLLCSYADTVAGPPGYDHAEVLLTGWSVENLGGPTPLQKLTLGGKLVSYDAATGDIEWEAAADLRAHAWTGDEYRFTLDVTLILTKTAGVQLLQHPNGCGSPGGGECQQRKVLPNAIPPGWDFLALGVRTFTLEAGAGNPPNGILLSRLALRTRGSRAVGTDFVSQVDCALHDATPTEPMACRADLIGIVAAPGEAFTAHFNSGHYAVQFFSSTGVEPPPGQPVDGAFGGLEDFLLSFGTPAASRTWSWAADNNDILLCPDNINFCYKRIGFLGDSLGTAVNALKFRLEIAGFAIWTQP
jgi:hypothetical protein